MPKMKLHVLLLNRLRLLRAKFTNWLAQNWGQKFYVYLAAAFTVFAFASINFGNTFINLAGPLMIGIVCFSVSRVYAAATRKVLERKTIRQFEKIYDRAGARVW